MINTDGARLEKVIRGSGLKRKAIAERLGLTYQGLHNKVTGKTEFTVGEVVDLQRMLGLSNATRDSIFFGVKGD